MLLEFSAKNYKSFREKLVFSMMPSAKKGLDYSIMTQEGGNKQHKGLCSAVIYGPNAAGKTNIIGAMETFKSIVVRGHIRNDNSQPQYSFDNQASNHLELIPFFSSKQEEPVEFGIKFVERGLYFDYSFVMQIGKFMEEKASRSIVKECLIVNDKPIFVRAKTIEIINLQHISAYLNDKDVIKNNITALASSGLNPDELFLVNGFKTLISKELVSIFLGWILNKFLIFYRGDRLRSNPDVQSSKEGELIGNKLTDAALKEFGSNSRGIGFTKVKDRSIPFSLLGENAEIIIPSDVFESYGTMRFLNEFPIILDTLAYGYTLVIDEFDASLHPMALMNIINIFHNDEINKYHAQLIFNTQNPIFLNNNLYRRDEIHFVDIDPKTHISKHYTLADFMTSSSGSRSTSDFMSNYFVNRYGAIRNIDFSNIVQEYQKSTVQPETTKE